MEQIKVGLTGQLSNISAGVRQDNMNGAATSALEKMGKNPAMAAIAARLGAQAADSTSSSSSTNGTSRAVPPPSLSASSGAPRVSAGKQVETDEEEMERRVKEQTQQGLLMRQAHDNRVAQEKTKNPLTSSSAPLFRSGSQLQQVPVVDSGDAFVSGLSDGESDLIGAAFDEMADAYSQPDDLSALIHTDDPISAGINVSLSNVVEQEDGVEMPTTDAVMTEAPSSTATTATAASATAVAASETPVAPTEKEAKDRAESNGTADKKRVAWIKFEKKNDGNVLWAPRKKTTLGDEFKRKVAFKMAQLPVKEKNPFFTIQVKDPSPLGKRRFVIPTMESGKLVVTGTYTPVKRKNAEHRGYWPLAPEEVKMLQKLGVAVRDHKWGEDQGSNDNPNYDPSLDKGTSTSKGASASASASKSTGTAKDKSTSASKKRSAAEMEKAGAKSDDKNKKEKKRARKEKKKEEAAAEQDPLFAAPAPVSTPASNTDEKMASAVEPKKKAKQPKEHQAAKKTKETKAMNSGNSSASASSAFAHGLVDAALVNKLEKADESTVDKLVGKFRVTGPTGENLSLVDLAQELPEEIWNQIPTLMARHSGTNHVREAGNAKGHYSKPAKFLAALASMAPRAPSPLPTEDDILSML